VHYSGAPLAIDFGEQANTPTICLVEASPSTPARVTDLPLTSAKRLRTLHGTVAELGALAAGHAEDYLRVVVREPARAGLREEVQAILPGALEVRIDPEFAAPLQTSGANRASGAHATPAELFSEFCAERGLADDRVGTLFGRLHDEVTGAESTAG
jgi:exonuclease SbcD